MTIVVIGALRVKKPTDLALFCLQRHGLSGFSRTRVKMALQFSTISS